MGKEGESFQHWSRDNLGKPRRGFVLTFAGYAGNPCSLLSSA